MLADAAAAADTDGRHWLFPTVSSGSSFLAAVNNAHINLSKSTAFHPSGTSIRVLVSRTTLTAYACPNCCLPPPVAHIILQSSVVSPHATSLIAQLCNDCNTRISPQSHVSYAFFITQFMLFVCHRQAAGNSPSFGGRRTVGEKLLKN